MVYRVRVRVRGCLSAFSPRDDKIYFVSRGLQIDAPDLDLQN